MLPHPTSLQLSSKLQALKIPTQHAPNHQNDTDPSATACLNAWKEETTRVLEELKDLIHQTEFTRLANTDMAEQVELISVVARFEEENASWTTPRTKALAVEIMQVFSEPTIAVVTEVLIRHIKPVFQRNPHPSLNISTGRKLHRQAGGIMASQDFYENQDWKDNVGLPTLVSWCVRHIKETDYSRVWHLVIPPIMTMIDDYQVPYKLRGVVIVSQLLERVPQDLLKRTGIDGLILKALNNCLGHFDHECSPSLIRLAINASLSLIMLATTSGSSARFDQLCALLGDGVIGTIWLYGDRKPDVIRASIEALPPLIRVLKVGAARYLKALIPQLVHPLCPSPFGSPNVKLQISSLDALATILEFCSPRINDWKCTILDGAARCWVFIMEKKWDIDESEREELKIRLRTVCGMLAKICPSVVQVEFESLIQCDHALFHDLLL
ncbi:hypothetical protein E1B28_003998 [Marasmius oreades]|uniref:ARM repeat superfamily protein n=1 Tax=Marasmius oreades TaxID=181124 RepID=A0A9P7UXP0_9AGAR|nr:uncharacterized protein E1B28_003998 [Marasmius oreades]KAG7096579.1 hypothetical protein E1B28_003998 [Marasmius oreades]